MALCCEERDYKGLHAFPSNITRDGPPITRDCPPSLLTLQGRTLTASHCLSKQHAMAPLLGLQHNQRPGRRVLKTRGHREQFACIRQLTPCLRAPNRWGRLEQVLRSWLELEERIPRAASTPLYRAGHSPCEHRFGGGVQGPFLQPWLPGCA